MNEETPNGQTPPPGSPPPPPRSPFQAPSSMGPSGGMNPGAAKDALNIPSLIMIILSVIGLIMIVISLASGGNNQEIMDMVNEYMRQAAEQSGQDYEPINMEAFAQGAIVGNYLMVGAQLLITIFVLWSCFKMRNLESWNMVLVANILAVLPCFMPCCCIQIPFAIWNLVLLNKPEIKAAFS